MVEVGKTKANGHIRQQDMQTQRLRDVNACYQGGQRKKAREASKCERGLPMQNYVLEARPGASSLENPLLSFLSFCRLLGKENVVSFAHSEYHGTLMVYMISNNNRMTAMVNPAKGGLVHSSHPLLHRPSDVSVAWPVSGTRYRGCVLRGHVPSLRCFSSHSAYFISSQWQASTNRNGAMLRGNEVIQQNERTT